MIEVEAAHADKLAVQVDAFISKLTGIVDQAIERRGLKRESAHIQVFPTKKGNSSNSTPDSENPEQDLQPGSPDLSSLEGRQSARNAAGSLLLKRLSYLVSSCDCNKNPLDPIDIDFHLPDEQTDKVWAKKWSGQKKSKILNTIASVLTDTDSQMNLDFVAKTLADEIYKAIGYGGTWSCSIGLTGQFGMSYQGKANNSH